MADVTYVPDNQANNVLPWMLAGNGGLGGFGSFNSIADLFGLAIIASMFGWGGWGNGGFGGGFGGNNAAGFLSNQLNNDSGRELIMNAINAQGEASRTAVSNLATALGQDFNLVNSGVQNVQNALQTLALQQAVSVPQIMNAIATGDASIISNFQKCCCDQKLLTVEQGYQSQIATLNQTNQLGSQADRNTRVITDAINAQTVAMNDQFCAAKERDMQSKIDTQADIITQLRNQISNDKQTEAFTAAFNVLNQKITDLAARQPNTVPVTWPNLAAVNTTPYVSGGYYQGGFNGYYGPGANGFTF
jgi:hypothetical protein